MNPEGLFNQPTVPNFTVEQFYIIPTEGYKDMVIRPINLNVDREDLNRIVDLLKTKLSGYDVKINPLELSGMNIIEPGDKVLPTEIPGGWGQPRGVFLLVIKYTDAVTGVDEMVYLTGFTDTPNFNPVTGAVDESMLLYPNTMVILTKVTNVDKFGNPYTYYRVTNTLNLEYDISTGEYYTIDDLTNAKFMLRPVDIMRKIEDLELSGDAISSANTSSTTKIISAIKKPDLLPTIHVTETLNGLITGAIMTDGTNVYDTLKASDSVLDPTSILLYNSFIKSLLRITKGRMYFSIKELALLDNSVLNKITIIRQVGQPTMEMPDILTSNVSEEVYIPTIEAKLSTMIRDMVSTLITKNMLMSITFTMTNATIDGSIYLTPIHATPVTGDLDVKYLVNKFKLEFEQLVVPAITYNNSLVLNINVYASILGETKISISVNGGPEILFIYPTFADNLYNSLLSDVNKFNEVTSSYKNIVDVALGELKYMTDSQTAKIVQ